MRTTRSVRTYREPSDTVSQVGVPTTASMDRSMHCRAGWTRGRRWSARPRPTAGIRSVGCLVDMKVDELWKNDNTLLEINTGNGKQMLCAVQPEKSPLTTEPGKRATKSLWCKARPEILSRKCLAVSTRTKYHHSRHFYCCQGVRP
jgi:hypothetical protein